MDSPASRRSELCDAVSIPSLPGGSAEGELIFPALTCLNLPLYPLLRLSAQQIIAFKET